MAFGKLGEIVRHYVKKGAKIYIDGWLHHRAYTCPTGQRKLLPEIVAESMIMLGLRSGRASESPTDSTQVHEEVGRP